MKIDFLYSTDFLAMNAQYLGHTCMHLLCRAGEGSFVFNERCYHIVKNDLVVMPNPTRAKNLAAAPGMEVEWFAADNKFCIASCRRTTTASGAASASTRTPSSRSTTVRRKSYWRTSTACATDSTTATCSSTAK